MHPRRNAQERTDNTPSHVSMLSMLQYENAPVPIFSIDASDGKASDDRF